METTGVPEGDDRAGIEDDHRGDESPGSGRAEERLAVVNLLVFADRMHHLAEFLNVDVA